MVKSVRKSARLTSTLLGGVSCMPIAMRSIAPATRPARSARRIASRRRMQRERLHAIAALRKENALAFDLEEQQREARRHAPHLDDVDPAGRAADAAERSGQPALERIDAGDAEDDHRAEG